MKIKHLYFSAIILALLIPQVSTQAQDLQGINWSDRISEETTDGEIIETPPIVEIGTIRLSRFSQMQSLTLQETIQIGDGEATEALYIFRAWHGGASQGEQLMLVTTSNQGVDVLGPYPQDFEKLVVKSASSEFGPIFELYGADMNAPLAQIEYFDGELIKQ